MQNNNNNNNNLLTQISNFENLDRAFVECSRRKKKCCGYQNILPVRGEKLLSIQENLRTDQYQWGKYREFWVCDPKKRLVMAAPFADRIVHHAIHRVIEPILDKNLSDSVFACRHGRGNRSAIQILHKKLNQIPKDKRYALKLDIKQYFPSIHHEILLSHVMNQLSDLSLKKLINDLLKSHPVFAARGCGIPIGNLTSQLFANVYISELDQIACAGLSSPYFWNSESELNPQSFYIRYMDDLVLVADNKKTVCETAEKIINYAEKKLKLEIPVYKRIHLGNAAVPFLGFLIDQTCEPLSRNKRRIRRKIKRLHKHLIKPSSYKPVKPSDLEMVLQSYQAWRTI
jgi:RNA-directed DNA polymerase